MDLLIDVNVRRDVAEYLASRGHRLSFVREEPELGASALDNEIARFADLASRTIVTSDTDFGSLINRVGLSTRRFQRAGRLTLRCEPDRMLARVQAHVDHIETEAEFCERLGQRLIVEVTNTTLVIVR